MVDQPKLAHINFETESIKALDAQGEMLARCSAACVQRKGGASTGETSGAAASTTRFRWSDCDVLEGDDTWTGVHEDDADGAGLR